MPKLVIGEKYHRALKRCSKQIRQRAAAALARFVDDDNLKGLNFEKLKGHDDLYTIRVGQNFRILLRRQTAAELGEHYAATGIGPHDIYDRL